MFDSSSNVCVYATSLVSVNEPLGNIAAGAVAGSSAMAARGKKARAIVQMSARFLDRLIPGTSVVLPTGAQKIACAARNSNPGKPREGGTLHVCQTDFLGSAMHAGFDAVERLSR